MGYRYRYYIIYNLVDAPYIEPISLYFYPNFMKKPKEEKKTDKKTGLFKDYMKKMI